jgi:hypothetical protein
MSKENNYKLAVALLRFKQAYKELVQASKALPDYDISANYPFYILDFEVIEPAVLQWCAIHASELMKNIPDRVDNPACISCEHFRKGLGPDGNCKGYSAENKCVHYPLVPFVREIAIPVLSTDISNLSDGAVQILYTEHMNTLYRERAT